MFWGDFLMILISWQCLHDLLYLVIQWLLCLQLWQNMEKAVKFKSCLTFRIWGTINFLTWSTHKMNNLEFHIEMPQKTFNFSFFAVTYQIFSERPRPTTEDLPERLLCSKTPLLVNCWMFSWEYHKSALTENNILLYSRQGNHVKDYV